MLGLITSDTVAFAVAVGIPAAVAVLVVIWARPRSQVAIWGAVSLGIVVVSAAGSNDVWARGAGPDRYGNPSTQMFLHYDGTSWVVAASPANPPDNSSWSDIVAAGDGSVWLVGSSTRPGPYASSMAFAARSCTG